MNESRSACPRWPPASLVPQNDESSTSSCKAKWMNPDLFPYKPSLIYPRTLFLWKCLIINWKVKNPPGEAFSIVQPRTVTSYCRSAPYDDYFLLCKRYRFDRVLQKLVPKNISLCAQTPRGDLHQKGRC